MSPVPHTIAPAVDDRDTGPAPAQLRRPWQTPRVIIGQEGAEIAAAEGLGELLGHGFFVSS